MDKTVSFTQQGAGTGLEGMRTSMAAQMGYGDMPGVGGAKKGGLGVQTGLASLDRILNRDNSYISKKSLKDNGTRINSINNVGNLVFVLTKTLKKKR